MPITFSSREDDGGRPLIVRCRYAYWTQVVRGLSAAITYDLLSRSRCWLSPIPGISTPGEHAEALPGLRTKWHVAFNSLLPSVCRLHRRHHVWLPPALSARLPPSTPSNVPVTIAAALEARNT